MEVVTINGAKRDETGKAANKIARSEGRIPAVLYGGSDNVSLSVTYNDIRNLIYTPDFKMAEVDVDGAKRKCIVKDIQFHPVTESIVHIDFMELSDDRPVKIEVPVRFSGVSPGVKGGGILVQQLRRIEIKALPSDLVNEVNIDISELELGYSVKVRDIDSLENIEVINDPAISVASVEVPRALKSIESETDEEEGEGAEGEGAEGEGAETEGGSVNDAAPTEK